VASTIKSYLSKDIRNNIHFWYCPSKVKWPRYKLVDNQVKEVKASFNASTFPNRDLHLFSKKKEYNNILYE